MAAGLVVGIYPTTDAKAIESALAAQQIDLGKVKVLTGNADAIEPSSLHFVDAEREVDEDAYDDEVMHGTGSMTDSGGTSVPGVTDTAPHVETFLHHGRLVKNYLSAFPIPDDEVENFDEAAAEGRAVVLYPDAGDDAPKIAAAFRAAGLRNVRSY